VETRNGDRSDGDRPGSNLGLATAGAPLWRKAPVLLLRYPEILVATATTAVILAIATAAHPLFLAGAGTAAVTAHTEALPSALAGVRIAQYGPIPGLSLEESTAERSDALAQLFSGMKGVGDPLVTRLGVAPQLTATTGAGRAWTVRLMSRTQAIEHVDHVAGTPGDDGVWVPDFIARDLELRPGDGIVLSKGSERARTEIAGVYRGLLFGRPTDYWETLSEYIYAPAGDDDPPPQFLIAGPQLFHELDGELRDRRPLVRWEFPLERAQVSLTDAEQLVADLRSVAAEIEDGQSAAATMFSFAEFFTPLPDLVESAAQTVAGIEGTIGLLSLASTVVALMMIAAACIYGVRRRRVEISLLIARGMSPLMLGGRAALEAAPVVAAAMLLGWMTAVPLMGWIGPSDVFGGGVVGGALGRVIVIGVVALLIIFVVSAVAAAREGELSLGRIPGAIARVPWELVVLLLAAGALYEVTARDVAAVESGDAQVKLDVFLVLFPILFMAAASGILTRLLARLLPRVRTIGREWPTAAYLASRRIASAPRLAHTLIAASALAVGILLFASTLARSVEATTAAKAHIATGSDVSAELFTSTVVPDDLPFPHTTVGRLQQMSLSSTDARATLLVVDPDTFGRAAFWDTGLAGQSLHELLGKLSDGEGELLPAVVTRAGLREGDETTLELFNTTLQLDVRAGLDAWPGMEANAPTVVVADDALRQTLEATGESLEGAGIVQELWAKGDPDFILSALDKAGVSLLFVTTAERVGTTPGLLATRWTFSYLQALAIAGGVAILAGMLLYLQARQRSGALAFALAARMGLGGRANRLSAAIELGFMLMIALVIGVAVALVAALLTYGRFDLLPELPPPPLLKIPLAVIAVTAAALVLAAWLGAVRMHRIARRANVVEVLRLAE
jgi:putative ABC transport system permease protein